MRLLRTIFVFVLFTAFGVQQSMADVFAHNIRFSKEGGNYVVRFVLSDNADSVLVTFKDGSTVLRTVNVTDLSAGDQSVTWDGLDGTGTAVPNGDYTVEVTAYDQGYSVYTTIYDQDHGLFTRGVTAIRNPALKAFGFIYTADNGGYGGLGTGIMRHAADGSRWGDVKGLPKVANTGATVGPLNLRYSSEVDWEGYIYLIGRDNREIYRYHTDTVDVALVDSGGYKPYTIEGLGIRGTGSGRYVGVAGVYYVFGFLLGNNAAHFGSKDTLLTADSTYQFYDVAFGRDSAMYVTFYSLGDTAKPGVAKFDLTGYDGTPLELSDAVWKATIDSGRANTLTYWTNPNASDESGDRIYFVNVDIAGGGNPGAGVGVWAITDLNLSTPTLTYAYTDVGQNNTQFRTDVAADVVGNAIYFENTTENVAIISPPTGGNNYTTVSLDQIKVRASDLISDVRVDANSDRQPDRLNDTVSVIGVVNSVNPTASSNRFQYFIQDETGGITITKGSQTGGGPVYPVGHRLLVRGVVAYFRGLTEIDIPDLTTDIEVLDSNNTVTPTVLTIAQYLADPESYEATLIKINGVAKKAGSPAWPGSNADANMVIWDGKDTLVMRIDRDTDMDGTTEPVYPVNVVGTSTQFTSASTVHDNGYQISPNFRADFTENVAVSPNPNFTMATPADGGRVVLDDSAQVVTFSWNPAFDLNGDTLTYQWVPIGFTALGTGNSARDTFIVRTGYEMLTYLGTADSVALRWTARAKDAGPIVASVDTATVWVVGGYLTGIEDFVLLPKDYDLSQNYPNPFNPSTVIQFALPMTSNVSLKIYDILGQEVATILDDIRNAGYLTTEWNGRNGHGERVASGVYFYRLVARSVDGSRDFVSSKKMVLLK
ncbi:MAG: T9SS type A sorting domain-containing protein [Ignavibacteriales bacterium]|nr:T9SS type A sorting domain-containing protein [Ignavibacteriales bacterium]